jgi:uncharacterized protein YdhG (YjbR/CyaY superfamily)
MNQSNDVDQYIAGFPGQTRIMLQQIREIIRKAAPEAEEVISYQMPAYRMKRILVYFAAFKNHIGFYPTSSGIEAFKSEFKGHKWSKGAVQFPLDQPLPAELITKIVKFRVEENSKK